MTARTTDFCVITADVPTPGRVVFRAMPFANDRTGERTRNLLRSMVEQFAVQEIWSKGRRVITHSEEFTVTLTHQEDVL